MYATFHTPSNIQYSAFAILPVVSATIAAALESPKRNFTKKTSLRQNATARILDGDESDEVEN